MFSKDGLCHFRSFWSCWYLLIDSWAGAWVVSRYHGSTAYIRIFRVYFCTLGGSADAAATVVWVNVSTKCRIVCWSWPCLTVFSSCSAFSPGSRRRPAVALRTTGVVLHMEGGTLDLATSRSSTIPAAHWTDERGLSVSDIQLIQDRKWCHSGWHHSSVILIATNFRLIWGGWLVQSLCPDGIQMLFSWLCHVMLLFPVSTVQSCWHHTVQLYLTKRTLTHVESFACKLNPLNWVVFELSLVQNHDGLISAVGCPFALHLTLAATRRRLPCAALGVFLASDSPKLPPRVSQNKTLQCAVRSLVQIWPKLISILVTNQNQLLKLILVLSHFTLID